MQMPRLADSRIYKCYILGTGKEYDRLSAILPLYKDQIEVLGIVTTQRQPFSILDHRPCITVDEMDISLVDYVIIAVAEWHPIANYLMLTAGVPEEKIIRSSVFYYPNFDFNEYIRLNNSNVSILSNNCLGGIIYNQLGLKAMSPTINMLCRSGKEYITFINNYEYYLDQEMKVFSENLPNQNDRMVSESNFNYLKGCLGTGEIVWLFIHDIYAEKAVETWNRRRRRGNFDNVVVLMTIINDVDAEVFSQLPMKRKLGFYYKDLHMKDILFVPEWNKMEVRAQFTHDFSRYTVAMNRPICKAPIYVDWIKFLNGKEDYLRYVYE